MEQPQRFLLSVHRLFCENTADSRFATLFFGEYNDGLRRPSYATCGHLPALLLRRDGDLERTPELMWLVPLFDRNLWNPYKIKSDSSSLSLAFAFSQFRCRAIQFLQHLLNLWIRMEEFPN